MILSLASAVDTAISTHGDATAATILAYGMLMLGIAIMGALWIALGDYYRAKDGLPPRRYPRPEFAPQRGSQGVSRGRVRSHRRRSPAALILADLAEVMS